MSDMQYQLNLLSMDVYGFHILFLFITNKRYDDKLTSGSLSVRVYIVQ
jgi:hypothetical protein